MKKAQFLEEQMVRGLREAGAEPVANAVKKHGVSDPTIYLQRKRFDQPEAGNPPA
jgi:putative transposase